MPPIELHYVNALLSGGGGEDLVAVDGDGHLVADEDARQAADEQVEHDAKEERCKISPIH